MSEFHESSDAETGSELTVCPATAERSTGSRLFLALLGAISLLYAAVLIYHVRVPPGTPARQAFLEECRRICLEYGLVSTGNVKHDARAYLTAVEARPLSEALSEILTDVNFSVAESESHPLLGLRSPDFALLNEHRETRQLGEFLHEGPVMLLFYYGFSCSHCVAQLFAIQDDLAYFRELGVRIVAISQDRPEATAAALAEYGQFDFVLLSDPGNQISQQYGCFRESSGQDDGFLKHGTFLLDSTGTVRWAKTGFTPFIDNRSLLVQLSRIQERQPAALASK